MDQQWIAILGSIDYARRDELDLKELDKAKIVLRNMGRALAEKGCGIVVYSGNSAFAEPDVVAGYVDSGKAAKGSIRVVYPISKPRPQFVEVEKHRDVFDFQADENASWEVSFYRSLQDVDGACFLGGGQSTFIAGIVAVTRRTPVIALGGFGGTTEKVRGLLNPLECHSVTKEEKRAMAEVNVDPAWAGMLVDILLAQKRRLVEAAQQNELLRKERSRQLLILVSAGVLVLAAALLLVILTWDEKVGRMLLLSALIAAPALAGAAASMIRSSWERAVGEPMKADSSSVVMALLGCAAGIIGGLLYVVAQLTALAPSASDTMAEGVSRLVPFALLTGFLAGFGTDAFFRKLRDRDVGSVEVPTFRAPSQSP